MFRINVGTNPTHATAYINVVASRMVLRLPEVSPDYLAVASGDAINAGYWRIFDMMGLPLGSVMIENSGRAFAMDMKKTPIASTRDGLTIHPANAPSKSVALLTTFGEISDAELAAWGLETWDDKMAIIAHMMKLAGMMSTLVPGLLSMVPEF